MKRLSYFISLLIIACSCQQLDGDRVPTKNFIQEYLIPESLSYSSYSDEFHFDGIWISDGEVLERMLEKYGDTVYNSSYFMPTNAVGVDFEKIEITSDMDFDSGHKAGESLADIVMFHGKSPWEFIQAGCPDSWIMESKEFKRIDKKVSEITPEDLKLIEPYFTIEFLRQPEQPGIHTITIRFIGEGVTVEGDFETTFE